MNYVVSFTEHLRDGYEYYAKVVESIAMAENLINSNRQPNVHCRVFELGRELELASETQIEPQPPKENVTFKVKARLPDVAKRPGKA